MASSVRCRQDALGEDIAISGYGPILVRRYAPPVDFLVGAGKSAHHLSVVGIALQLPSEIVGTEFGDGVRQLTHVLRLF